MKSWGTRTVWLPRTGCGFGLGAAIALLEFAYYAPLAPSEAGTSPQALLSLLVLWGGEGTLFALLATAGERWVQPRELRGLRLGLTVVVSVAASVLVWQGIARWALRDQMGIPLFRDLIGQPGIWISGVMYHAWLLLVFGGLACAAYTSQRRYARVVASLRAAELARASSQQVLAQASLSALEARIDPDYVMATLARLENLYTVDPDSAERVLDELILFLRSGVTMLRADPAQLLHRGDR